MQTYKTMKQNKSLETNSYICSQVIFNRNVKNSFGKRLFPPVNGDERAGFSNAKEGSWTLTTYKYLLKMDSRPKSKNWKGKHRMKVS